MNFNGVQRTLVLSEDKKNLVQIEPMQNPPANAQFVSKDFNIKQGQNLTGYWDWKVDGKNKSGELLLNEGGRVEFHDE